MMKKHPHIAMCDCKSSQLKSHGYDSASKTLAVQFKGGGTYHYAGVPQDVYDKLCKSESIGKFLGQAIKGKFGFVKMGK